MYSDLIKNIDSYKNKYSHELIQVCVFDKDLARRIGDRKVYISEFVLAIVPKKGMLSAVIQAIG